MQRPRVRSLRPLPFSLVGFTLGLALLTDLATAQAADSTGRTWRVGLMAVGVASTVSPGLLTPRETEGYLTQPMVMLSAQRKRFAAFATFNAEGLTLRRGELNPGVYGEGFVDRRHPHTAIHEVMIGMQGRTGRWQGSVFAGKGFISYGSDDPMGRPFVKYPANHHHAQILERAAVIGAVRRGPFALEASLFNGDEPESTTDFPNWKRGLDSWATRVSMDASAGITAAVSAASVVSPEFADGGGLDQRKLHAAVRLERPGQLRYALIEGARTRELRRGTLAFEYLSYLAEGLWSLSTIEMAIRLERTERPEEERLTSLYRSVRPHHDFNTLGKTRWSVLTVHASGRRPIRGVVRPFVEVGLHAPRALLKPTPIDPVELFGARRITMISVGARVHAGEMRSRLGPYGSALRPGSGRADSHTH